MFIIWCSVKNNKYTKLYHINYLNISVLETLWAANPASFSSLSNLTDHVTRGSCPSSGDDCSKPVAIIPPYLVHTGQLADGIPNDSDWLRSEPGWPNQTEWENF